MTAQLALGSLVILATVILATGFAGAAVWMLGRLRRWLVVKPHWPRFFGALTVLVLWIQLAATLCVWLWAGLFLWLGVFEDVESAVYFSIVSFTTLGFGDILLEKSWRLLSGLAAANGLLMFGFFTAFLVEMMRRVRREQITGIPEED